MFSNIQELVKEIEEGKSTEDIVQERLEYLNSTEYQRNMHRSDGADFVQGFISDDEKIGVGLADTTYYWMDEKQIFQDVIDSLIRRKISEIKEYNVINIRSLMSGVQNYFFRAQPNQDSLTVYRQMCQEEKSKSDIREDFGERLKQYLLSKKNESEREELLSEINKREDTGSIVPIPISAIKGLGIGECTELALMFQNLMSFLGYNVFMIEGKTINSLGQQERHHFNIIEKNGSYVVLDSAMNFFAVAPEIKTPEDLLIFGEMNLQNKQGDMTYFSNRKANVYSNLESRRSLLVVKGDNYKNFVMSDLQGIELSKRMLEKTNERDYSDPRDER